MANAVFSSTGPVVSRHGLASTAGVLKSGHDGRSPSSHCPEAEPVFAPWAMEQEEHALKALVLSSGYHGRRTSLRALVNRLERQGRSVSLHEIRVRRAKPGAGWAARIPGYLRQQLTAWLAASACGRYDQIYAVNSPPYVEMPLVLRAAITGERLSLVHLDIFPRNAEVAGLLSFTPAVRILEMLTRALAAMCSEHITLSDRMAETLREMLGAGTQIVVDPDVVGAPSLTPVAHADNAWRSEHGLEGKYVVMYAGNLGAMYDFEPLLRAARELSDCEELVFVFVGDGHYRDEISAAVERSCGNIRLLPPQPGSRLSEVLSAADLHVVPLKPGADAVMWPSKIHAIRAVGKTGLAVGWTSPHPSLATVSIDELPQAILDRLHSAAPGFGDACS